MYKCQWKDQNDFLRIGKGPSQTRTSLLGQIHTNLLGYCGKIFLKNLNPNNKPVNE